MADDYRSRRVSLPTETDLTGRLERAALEYVQVNDTRIVAIAKRSIFVVDVDVGTVTAADELTARLWAPPPSGASGDTLARLLEEFVDELTPVRLTS